MTTKPASSRSLLSLSSNFGSNILASTARESNSVPTKTITVTDTASLRSYPGTSQRSLGGLLGGGGALDTSLHYGKLEELLCVRIPSYSSKIKSVRFRGLADKSSRRKQDLTQPIICFLEDTLASSESKEFSFEVLVDIHSFLGVLYELQGDSQSAIDYFMSALWLLHKPFKSRATTLSKGYDLNTHVAINLYRLGAAYGKLGHMERMHETYDRAEFFREGDIFIAASSKH